MKTRKFDVVLFRDIERLARGSDLSGICKKLEFYQCALLGVVDMSDSADPSFRMRVGLSAILSAEMIEKIRALTLLALQTRVKEGHSAGGVCYGYRSQPVNASNPEGRKRLVVEATEAALVLRIFSMYADGIAPRKIAAQLNAEGVPSPGARWKRVTRRSDGKWLASAIHGDPRRGSGILNNEKYVGRTVYGRRQFVKNPDSGVRVVRPGEERIEYVDERLRIVPQALWDRVHVRRRRVSETAGALVLGGLRKRAGGAGRPGKYLFTGLLTCDVCKASFVLQNREYYSCATHWNGGGCSNTIKLPRSVVQEVMLDGIREDLADPAVIDEVERRFRAALRRSEKPVDNRKRIAQLEREIANVTNAIASGLLSTALAERLRSGEAELSRIKAQAAARRTSSFPVPDVRGRFLELVKNLDQVLMRDPERGRDELRGILGGKVMMVPDESGGFLWADYSLGLTALLPKQGSAEIMVAGAGLHTSRLSMAA